MKKHEHEWDARKRYETSATLGICMVMPCKRQDCEAENHAYYTFDYEEVVENPC
jgi:hypothetical protein